MINKHYYGTREEWLELRNTLNGLGGSEVGSVLGLNPYSSAYEVWARRKGLIAPKADNEAMRQGRDLEDYVAQRFTEASGLEVHRVNAILTNDEYPHLFATIDRKVSNRDAGLECKTASALNAKAYRGGEFPASYYVQCCTYLAVTGLKTWYLAVLVLGKEFKVYALTRDANYQKEDFVDSVCYVAEDELVALNSAVTSWYETYIVGDGTPEVDGSSATTNAINEAFPVSNGETIDLMPYEANLRAYKELQAQSKEIETQMETIAQEIKAYMGESETAICDIAKVSWKSSSRKTLDAKAVKEKFGDIPDECYKVSSSRTFKITFNK